MFLVYGGGQEEEFDKGMDSSHVKMGDEEIVEGFLLGYFLGDVFEVKLEFHRLSGG